MFKIFKGEKKNKKLWQFVGLIFLVGAVISGVVLVKESQDIREKAGGCRIDEDCAYGRCFNSQCVTGDKEWCTTDGDCSSGKVCVEGDCLTPKGGGGGDLGSECYGSNSDCIGSLVCIDKICSLPIQGGNCQDNTDCEGSKVCIDSKCSLPINGDEDDGEEGSCTDDSDCPNDRKCQNGRCLSAGGGPGVFGGKCNSDNPCSGGRECSTTIGRCMQIRLCRRFSKILKCE